MHGAIAIARTIDLMLMAVDMQGATLWGATIWIHGDALPDRDRVVRGCGGASRTALTGWTSGAGLMDLLAPPSIGKSVRWATGATHAAPQKGGQLGHPP